MTVVGDSPSGGRRRGVGERRARRIHMLRELSIPYSYKWSSVVTNASKPRLEKWEDGSVGRTCVKTRAQSHVSQVPCSHSDIGGGNVAGSGSSMATQPAIRDRKERSCLNVECED